jgi:putative ABC transport system ATP-binding protein
MGAFEKKQAVISTQQLSKTYQIGENKIQALNDVSLTIAEGEFVAIMGASGSGKSTLMNMLGCLDIPTAGAYFFRGKDVTHLSRDERASVRSHNIGFVFQGFNLLTRTSAIDNVALPLMYDRQAQMRSAAAAAKEALERVGLGNRLAHEPTQLSGGQQQRVAIARALVNHPQVVLADEPTGNLDSKTSLEIMSLFQALNDQGITLIIVTHEPDIAQFAKRNIVMRDGQIAHDVPVKSAKQTSQINRTSVCF